MFAGEMVFRVAQIFAQDQRVESALFVRFTHHGLLRGFAGFHGAGGNLNARVGMSKQEQVRCRAGWSA